MGGRKRDEHSENAHRIQTVTADKPPGKAKAGRKSGKYRHKSGILPTPGFKNQRGGAIHKKAWKDTRCSTTQESLRLKSGSLNTSNRKGIPSASTQRNHKEEGGNEQFNFSTGNKNSPKKMLPQAITGGPVVRTLTFTAVAPGSTPGQGTKITQAVRHSQKKKKCCHK